MTNSNANILGYIGAKQTITAAAAENLSVGDYLEKIWDESGNRYRIANDLLTITGKRISQVCEIGTGAGLLAELIMEYCSPSSYESYEPDQDWADWLSQGLGLLSHPADGVSLNQTASSSIDLALAHGVFVYLPFLSTIGYIEEMVRITIDGGYIAFDIFSENCLDDETIQRWLASDDRYACFLSRGYITEFLKRRSVILVGSFFNRKYGVGRSEYLVFQKNILAS